jgi:hypothetical protein
MSNHISINIDRTHKMQLYPGKTESVYKVVASLFQTSLNDSYFEKWRAAQEEIVQLRREIYALKRSSMQARFTERPTLDPTPSAHAINAGPLDSPV